MGDEAALSKLANFLVAQDALDRPRQDVVSAQFDAPVRARVDPGADRDAMQPREMSAAADEPAKVARESADVIAAAHREAHCALHRQIVVEPDCFVEINT